MNTVGLDEAKVRKYIKDQEEADRYEDRGEPEAGDPFVKY